MEPTNIGDKQAVEIVRVGHTIGHWKRGASRRNTNTIFYFLQGHDTNSYRIEVTGKT